MALDNNNQVCHLIRPPGSLILALGILLNVCLLTCYSDTSESEILMKFKDSISNNAALSSWNSSKPPCPTGNWVGVYCLNNKVWGLKLQNMGLKGYVDMEILKDLLGLRTMSLMGNEFDGDFPNVKVASSLKALYLSDNKFAGEISANAFNGMISLKKFHAARNQLTGSIPASLAVLPRLMELKLEGNRLSGEIPDFQQETLNSFNVSNNQLDGPIPQNLLKLHATSFAGNKNLCGGPLPACHNSMVKLPVGTIVVSGMVAVAALMAIVAAFIILRHRKQPNTQPPPHQAAAVLGAGPTMIPQLHHRKKATTSSSSDYYMDKVELGSPPAAAKTSATAKNNSSSGGCGSSSNQNQTSSFKLTFLRDDRERFDLSDLLRASAEVLGSGVFGSTYKAALGSSSSGHDPVMVVKRYRQMNNVGREDFQEHMRRLGRLKHPNLLPLVAFYYRKEEKLLVSDYVANVSLAVHLHGNRGRGGVARLDWAKRLKIVKGTTRGLLYLYEELPSLVAPHGHLKSANVLLNESWEPLLADYALSPIVNQEQAQDLMIAYKSPEYKQLGRITKKTDVWSLGILILEILTGRFPTHTIQGAPAGGTGKSSDMDLATWVQSSIATDHDWMSQVFDKDMGFIIGSGKQDNNNNNHNIADFQQDQMVKLLKIGLRCCETDVDKRWDIKEVVERIEELRDINMAGDGDGVGGAHNHNHNTSRDEDFYSSYASEGDMRSSRGLSDDFTNSTWNA